MAGVIVSYYPVYTHEYLLNEIPFYDFYVLYEEAMINKYNIKLDEEQQDGKVYDGAMSVKEYEEKFGKAKLNG